MASDQNGASTTKFAVGQTVECVRSDHDRLTRGRLYEVLAVNPPFIRIIDDLGRNGMRWYEDRFVAAAIPAPDQSPPESLKQASDNVFRPNHYARFVIEPLTFINANGLSYNIGNVIKYACRYDAKNGLEDLKKARRYLDIQIETLDRQARIAAGEDATSVWKNIL